MTPLDLLIIEIIYVVLISVICLAIYLKTRDIYNLSKHSGIFHFRNIFLYFALAYLSRLAFMFVIMSYGLRPRMLLGPHMLVFFIVGYFSTMAILSISTAVVSRKIDISKHSINNYMHIIAVLLSVFVFMATSYDFLIIIQTFILLATVVILFTQKPKKKETYISKQNKITYLLLLIFWILNLFASSRGASLELTFILYIISVGIFLSIYLRVKRRLVENGQKKK